MPHIVHMVPPLWEPDGATSVYSWCQDKSTDLPIPSLPFSQGQHTDTREKERMILMQQKKIAALDEANGRLIKGPYLYDIRKMFGLLDHLHLVLVR